MHLRKNRLASGAQQQAGSYRTRNAPRDSDFDPFAATFEIRQLSKSPFNEAALIFLLLLTSGICVLLVVFYAALRAIGL